MYRYFINPLNNEVYAFEVGHQDFLIEKALSDGWLEKVDDKVSKKPRKKKD